METTSNTRIKKPAPKGRQTRRGLWTPRTDYFMSCCDRKTICRLGCAKPAICSKFHLVLSTKWYANRFPLKDGLRRNAKPASRIGLCTEILDDVFTSHAAHCTEPRTRCQWVAINRVCEVPYKKLLTLSAGFRTLRPCRNTSRLPAKLTSWAISTVKTALARA